MLIKKVVIPVAGLGTRFLPATKSTPKEMLPVVDKPLIQYAVEEASKAGIKEFIFITHHSKSSIKKHFEDGSTKLLRHHTRSKRKSTKRKKKNTPRLYVEK